MYVDLQRYIRKERLQNCDMSMYTSAVAGTLYGTQNPFLISLIVFSPLQSSAFLFRYAWLAQS